MFKTYMQHFHKFSNFKKLYREDKFILVALNLAFISYYKSEEIKFKGKVYLWPDGIFSKFYNFKNKIPGSELIKKISLNTNIKKIKILGNLSKKDKKFLKNKFKKKVEHLNLPFGNINLIKKKIFDIKDDCLYLITLPTPKQEKLADYIAQKTKNYKIICIGGGLSIASGETKECPKLLRDIGLEFIWRLRTDFLRRLTRLLFTSIIIIKNFKSKRIITIRS